MTLTELKLFLRDPIATFFTLAFPLMLLFIYGSIYGNDPYYNNFGIVDYMVPGLIALTIACITIVGMPTSVAVYRERGILRRLLATPLRPATLIVANILVNFVMAGFGTLLTITAAKIVFNLRFSGDIFYVTLAFILSCASFVAIGFLLAGLPIPARATQTLCMVIFFSMMFLSGSTIPREEFSPLILKIAEYNPLTYVVDLLQKLWFGKTLNECITEIGVLTIILVTCAIVATKTFRWK